MRRYAWLGLLLAALALWAWQQRAPSPGVAPTASTAPARDAGPQASPRFAQPTAGDSGRYAARWPAWLPPEALDTLARIDAGGPFPHRQDGATFQNRERRLPPRPRGYYREYTVETPRSRDRGARRIVAGGGVPGDSPPSEYFYSDDHYRSFRHFLPSGAVR